ncbi:MAG: hypothetical protein R3A11_09545 [Bdellovibrionota bacterium]
MQYSKKKENSKWLWMAIVGILITAALPWVMAKAVTFSDTRLLSFSNISSSDLSDNTCMAFRIRFDHDVDSLPRAEISFYTDFETVEKFDMRVVRIGSSSIELSLMKMGMESCPESNRLQISVATTGGSSNEGELLPMEQVFSLSNGQ